MAYVSNEGRRLIQNYESCRLKAYRDSNGIWTIGWGHTGPEVVQGLEWTQDKADQVFAADLGRFERAVENFLGQSATQGQFDAMVSLAYNIGTEGFRTSSVLRRFNSGDLKGSARAFALWIKDNDSIEEGLVYRRAAEIVRFMS